MTTTQLTVATPRGEALVALDRGRRRAGALLALGHGAAGDVDAVDLVAVRDAAVRADLAVARVTQPYRVGGRRPPPPARGAPPPPPPAAPVLDEAWLAAVAAVRSRFAGDTALIVGGRSSGARVACRTARVLGATGVLALAFPLHPPGRPEMTRSGELDPGLPTLVINGDRDPFGVPAPEGRIQVVVLPGERHELKKNPAAVASAAMAWLTDLLV
jgi:predicted alpha/beta-hydrolase family hydrolase